ncbi:hypothetical protein [Actinokineospora fastidiosa]|uniref:hypothetical protein n=1 Tax=Actinokineospora fastidiosa TaxID=1816 RepID=UPI0016702A88|nr:hypothetical protein [Actinokineospora fastidiosa]
MRTYWRTVAVEAAPPGWRLLSIYGERREVMPIAAWLLQHEHRYVEQDGDEVLAPPQSDREAKIGPETRVVPGVCVEGWGWEVGAVDLEGGSEIWKVLGPDEVGPTDAEWDAEIARRRPKL